MRMEDLAKKRATKRNTRELIKLIDERRQRSRNSTPIEAVVPAQVSSKLVKKTISRRAILGILLAGTAMISAPTTLRAALANNYIIFNPADNGVTDNSATLQTAIDTAWAQPFGGTVYGAPSSAGYVIDNITLRNQVDLLGGGMRETQFLAKPGSTNPVFKMDTGHVINCRYENFMVSAAPAVSFTATGSGTNFTISAPSANNLTVGVGGSEVQGVGIPINTYLVSQTSGTTGGAGVYVTNNATTASAAACTGVQRQHCFSLAAVIGGSGDGGMWYSIFKNVFVNQFGGYGWWFRGGPNSFVQPHQFITLDSCIAIRPSPGSYYSRCVLLTGQCGQFKFQGECDFDGLETSPHGFNIEMGAEFVFGSLIGGPLIGGTAAAGGGPNLGTPVNGPRTPYNIIFHGITSQNALTAIYTYNTFDIVIDSCYFEDVAQVIVTSVAFNTAIINNHFTNSGIFAGAGFIINMTNGSWGTAIGNDANAPDRFIANGSGNGSGLIWSQGNTMVSPPTNLDSNMTWAVNGPTVDLRFAFQAYINTTTPITSITSNHSVGDRISFVNNQGGPSATITAGNNIKLGHWTTLTLGNFDTALFELSEIAAGWQLIGTTGTLS